jgi:hypothetical protein
MRGWAAHGAEPRGHAHAPAPPPWAATLCAKAAAGALQKRDGWRMCTDGLAQGPWRDDCTAADDVRPCAARTEGWRNPPTRCQRDEISRPPCWLGSPTARAVGVGWPRDQLHCVRVGRFTLFTQWRGLRMRGAGGRRAGAERGSGSGGCGAAPCVVARLDATRRRVRAGTPTPPRVQWGCETAPFAVWRRCDTSQ